MQSDLLSNLYEEQKYDLIIANLPYVDKNWTWLGAELSFEPESALFAEDGGLELIKKIILQAPSRLNSHGYLLLEADQIQHQAIIDFAQKSGYFESVKKADEKSALVLVLRLR